jgi:hypothetical protein
VNTRGEPARVVAQAKARESSGIDASAALLIAFLAVLLALIAGTGLFLLLPATF